MSNDLRLNKNNKRPVTVAERSGRVHLIAALHDTVPCERNLGSYTTLERVCATALANPEEKLGEREENSNDANGFRVFENGV